MFTAISEEVRRGESAVLEKQIEVRQLQEFDSGEYLNVCGYYANGLHSLQQFAITVNQDYELACYDQPIIFTSMVEHGYLRKIPDGCGGYLVVKSKPGKGAFAATFCFNS